MFSLVELQQQKKEAYFRLQIMIFSGGMEILLKSWKKQNKYWVMWQNDEPN